MAAASEIVTRRAARDVEAYLKRVAGDDDRSKPSDNAIRLMSAWFDHSARRIFDELQSTLFENNDAIERGVKELDAAPRKAGKSEDATPILENLTPFEQQVAICRWVSEKKLKKIHTHVLATPDGGYFPLRVTPIRGRGGRRFPASLMTTMLGATKGALKAPKYEEWAKTDPRGTDAEIFIHPLNGLEINRHPDCLGALLLKSNSFDAESMTHERRYRVKTAAGALSPIASVELPGQSKTDVRRIKAQAAGYNLVDLIEAGRSETNLIPLCHYEDYRDEGYEDDTTVVVNPTTVVRTFSAALKNETDELDAITRKLFVTRLGHSKIPVVKTYAADSLFGPGK